jgi:hypothetical protein
MLPRRQTLRTAVAMSAGAPLHVRARSAGSLGSGRNAGFGILVTSGAATYLVVAACLDIIGIGKPALAMLSSRLLALSRQGR